MLRHVAFEWDDNKAKNNLARHGVSFREAADILMDAHADVYHVEAYQHRGGEDRWMTLTCHPRDRNMVFYIVWASGASRATRIISARKATRTERGNYEKQIYGV